MPMEHIIDTPNRDRKIKHLRRALLTMVEHDVDYMKINNLGDPEEQSRIIAARKALKQ
jgi:hypothetical protein